ncbi:hypothetical protein [Gimesia aquarii]|uniref:Secretin/TonB short N-terminal domain-containing protein n=1 Tax=Gimesia aquarii TaxID=2527964 RepID=A0A517W2K1_9PLAN|nr:hypothetical protein [Gimesia aquarii]QDT99493.1 hypothetical protein V144x_50040 [Gimesia aquarii]
MSGFLKRRFVVLTIFCLAAGWMTIVASGQEKRNSKASQAHKPTVKDAAPLAAPAGDAQKNGELQQTFFPVLTKQEQKIQAALNAETECNFIDNPLSEVINTFADQHGLTILILSNDLGEEGLTSDEPVNISLHGISLKNALELILQPIGLTYVVDRDVVQITTKYNAEEMLKTRVYPVGDLCKSPDDYQALESAIINASLGEWRSRVSSSKPSQPVQAGGLGGGFGGGTGGKGFFQFINGAGFGSQVYEEGTGGTISVVPQSRSLVISQTYHAHNAIVDLLTQLRQARVLD